MILTIALHKPKGPQEEGNFLKSFKAYGEVQGKHKGHQLYSVGKDDKTGILIVVSLWDKEEDLLATRDDMLKFRKMFDFKTN